MTERVGRTPLESSLYYQMKVVRRNTEEANKIRDLETTQLHAEITRLRATQAQRPKPARKAAPRVDRIPAPAPVDLDPGAEDGGEDPRDALIPRVDDEEQDDIGPLAPVDADPGAEAGGEDPRDALIPRVEDRAPPPRDEDGEDDIAPPAPVDADPGAEAGGEDPRDALIPRVEDEQQDRKRLDVYHTITRALNNMPAKKRLRLLKQVTPADKLKELRLVSLWARDVKVDRRSLTRGPRGENRRDRKYKYIRKLIIKFLKRPEHSYTCPGKKEFVAVEKVKYQKVILTEFTDVLHQMYNDEYPDHQISLTFFNKTRRAQRYIKVVHFNTTQVCLCIQHQNFTLRLRALGVTDQPDTVVRDYTADAFRTLLGRKTLPATIKCQTWHRIDVAYGDPKEGKTCKKLRLVPSESLKDTFIHNLMADYEKMTEHTQRAQTQHRVVRHLRQNLSAAECTIQMDFAENWMVSYPEEPQSVYYAKEPVTLHPAVIHYRDAEGDIQHSSVALVTDDRKHDSGAILAFLQVLCKFIRDTLPDTIRVIHYCSDSPSSQYRNKSIFSILCKHQQLLGFNATWTYFEAGHGKGPCDGIGAAAKRNADAAVKRKVLIRDAAEFAVEGRRRGGAVHYICVPVVDVMSARDRVPTLAAEQSVRDTMKVHAAVCLLPDHVLSVRDTSCFDVCCWKDSKSIRQCDGWTDHVMFDIPLATVDSDPDAEDDIAPPVQGDDAPPQAQESYDINDFLACVYDDTWYLGQVSTEANDEGEFKVSFMERASSANYQFRWPRSKDTLDISPEDVVMRTCAPTPVGSGRRAALYALPDNVILEVEAKFALHYDA